MASFLRTKSGATPTPNERLIVVWPQQSLLSDTSMRSVCTCRSISRSQQNGTRKLRNMATTMRRADSKPWLASKSCLAKTMTISPSKGSHHSTAPRGVGGLNDSRSHTYLRIWPTHHLMMLLFTAKALERLWRLCNLLRCACHLLRTSLHLIHSTTGLPQLAGLHQ
jgi:hypothetical protein